MIKYVLGVVSFIVAGFCFSGCQSKRPAIVPPKIVIPAYQQPQRSEKSIVIVLIHGTILPLPSFTCTRKSLWRYLFDNEDFDKSWYDLYIKEMRRNSFLKYQPNGPRGLCLVGRKSSLAAQLSACFFDDFYKKSLPGAKVYCYTFGWSGRLSQRHRMQSACDLYQQLTRELSVFDRQNTEVILVGHSHGGNVILNLARAEKQYKDGLSIDRAVLLGMPVQSETEKFCQHGMFKKIYHCYSSGDNVQKIDFISTKDNYSQRRFSYAPAIGDVGKMTQIELRFGSYMPGHGELWLLWGKDNGMYRKKLPIYPLPFFFFLPEMIKHLEQKVDHPTDLLVTVDQAKHAYTIICCDKECGGAASPLVVTLDKKPLQPYIKTVLAYEGIA